MSFSDILTLGRSTLEQALILSFTVLALFLSYLMLNVCDLSTDGCFTLGAVVGAIVAKGSNPFVSILCAMCAGIVSGFIVSLLQTKLGINSLLAGIIVNTGLYSVNMAIMGGSPNISIVKSNTVFSLSKKLLKDTPLRDWSAVIVLAVILALIIIFLRLFLGTRAGLSIRATGDNPEMVKSSSINPAVTTTAGLCISGSITALSGCLMAQFDKSCDVNIGSGMVTVALASLLIGHVFFGKMKMTWRLIGMVVGAFVFRLVYTLALRVNMPAYMLKLVSSIIVIAAISLPYLKTKLPLLKRRFAKKGGKGNA